MGWLNNLIVANVQKAASAKQQKIAAKTAGDEIAEIDRNSKSVAQKENINTKRLNKARTERDKKEKAADGLKLVIDGAKLQCILCTNPQGTLKVNFDTPTTQDKKTATVKEKNSQSLVFMGNCKKSPNSASPCKAVMQLGEWKDTGTLKIQNEAPLLLKSTIPCNYGGVSIKITDCGQVNEPESINGKGPAIIINASWMDKLFENEIEHIEQDQSKASCLVLKKVYTFVI